MTTNYSFVYESFVFESKSKSNKNLIKTPWGHWSFSTSYDHDGNSHYFIVDIYPEVHMEKMKIIVEVYGGICTLNYLIGSQVAELAEPNSKSYKALIDAEHDEYIEKYKLKIKFQLAESSKDPKSTPFGVPPKALPGSVTDYLSKAFASKMHADVTIQTSDGNEIEANKFILSRSPVFDAMLNRHNTKEAQEGIIKIIDFSHEVVTEMVRFLYTDEVPKLEGHALDLMIAANKYDIRELFNICKNYLKANITTMILVDILALAECLKLDDLKDIVMQHIIQNSEKIFASPEWKSFEENNVQIAMNVVKDCFAKINNRC